MGYLVNFPQKLLFSIKIYVVDSTLLEWLKASTNQACIHNFYYVSWSARVSNGFALDQNDGFCGIYIF